MTTSNINLSSVLDALMCLRPRYVNLSDEFSSGRACIIDGDALLMHLLRDPRLSGTADPSGSPVALDSPFGPGVHQCLHLHWLLEKFVAGLVSRGAAPRVVWFERHAVNWRHCPAAVLARRLAIRALSRLVPSHFVVSDCCDPRWMDLLREVQPAFVMLDEGQAIPPEASESLRGSAADLPGALVSPSPDAPAPLAAALLSRALLLSVLRTGHHVVLLRRMGFQEHRVYGYLERGQAVPAATLGLLASAVLPVRQALDADEGEGESRAENTAAARLKLTAGALGVPPQSRRAMLAAAVTAVMASSPTDANTLSLCRLVVIAEAIMAQLPLCERGLVLPPPAEMQKCPLAAAVPAFLAALCGALAAQVDPGDHDVIHDVIHDVSHDGDDDVDVLDGRLLVFLASTPCLAASAPSTATLGALASSRAESTWDAVCLLAGGGGNATRTPLMPVLGCGHVDGALLPPAVAPAPPVHVSCEGDAYGTDSRALIGQRLGIVDAMLRARFTAASVGGADLSEYTESDEAASAAAATALVGSTASAAAPPVTQALGRPAQSPETLLGGAVDPATVALASNEIVATFYCGDEGLMAALLPPNDGVASELLWSSKCFRKDFHWHTGEPIEADVWTSTEDKTQQDAKKYKALSLDELVRSRCPLLGPGFLKGLARTLEAAKHLNDYERASKMRDQTQRAHVRIEKAAAYKEQVYARHMESYAASLSGTIFKNVAVVTRAKGRPGSASASAPPALRPVSAAAAAKEVKEVKESKKDKIIRENKARQGVAVVDKMAERWTSLKSQLDSDKEWGPKSVDMLDAFIADCGSAPSRGGLVGGLYRLRRFMVRWEAGVKAGIKAGIKANGLVTAKAAGQAGNAAALVSAEDRDDLVADAVQVWETAQVMASTQGPSMADGTSEGAAAVAEVAGALARLGFAAAAAAVAAAAASAAASAPVVAAAAEAAVPGKKASQDKKAKAPGPDYAAVAAASELSLGLSEAAFQLRFCGHLLPRDTPATADPRAESFNPDAWQRTLLDVVDAGASAVVCAPTSAGKTFISSYVIKRTLAADDVGCVVFVAPTKALVNQVAAQMYKDFGQVYGVFTADYRQRPTTSRVLVTVPQCLEILLLSPVHREWVKRLRYAIFDEVHCIDEESGGAVWEHLLLMCKCPLLALSATVGNPGELVAWLRDAKKTQGAQEAARVVAETAAAHGNKAGRALALPAAPPTDAYSVYLVEHSERFSDLRSSVYLPPPSLTGATGGAGRALTPQDLADGPLAGATVASGPLAVNRSESVAAAGRFARLHPCCAISSAAALAASGFPSTLSLEPQDALELFEALSSAAAVAASQGGVAAAWAAAQAPQLTAHHPDAHFAPAGARIRRGAARAYGVSLCATLVRWAKSAGAGAAAADETLRIVAGFARAAIASHEAEWASRGRRADDGGFLLENFPRLLLDLAARDRLPAIVFNFERRACMRLAAAATATLEALERSARGEAAAQAEADGSAAAKRRASRSKAPKADRDKKVGRVEAQESLELGLGDDEEEDEDEPDDDFSFVRRSLGADNQKVADLMADVSRMATDGNADNAMLWRALKRGVGVHHAGLPKRYRQAVEILFRCRWLRVVVATGTLAYGINVPCRTVVFAGDSFFFSPLQFRQMSGRAGRRGFDSLGHIVFYGVPPDKVSRLLVSQAPRLHGQFPLTVTTLLRLLFLHAAVPASDKAEMRDACIRLITCAFYPYTAHGAGPPPTSVAVKTTAVAVTAAATAAATFAHQMRFYVSFVLRYLRDTSLLGPVGEPVGLSGLAMHIYYTEPGNLALLSLLHAGVLHDMCEAATSWPDLASSLLLVFAHLFEAKPIHPALVARARAFGSPSRVVLAPLPPVITAALQRFNAHALDTAAGTVRDYVMAAAAGGTLVADFTLPLSGRLCESPGGGGDTDTPLGVALATACVRPMACSPFACLSGRGDAFGDVDELLASAHACVRLERKLVPYVEGGRDVDRPAAGGAPMLLNAYVMDYWAHGQRVALVTSNFMLEGEAWQSLQTVTSVLRAVAVALHKIAAPGDAVAANVGRLADEYHHKFRRFNEGDFARGHGR